MVAAGAGQSFGVFAVAGTRAMMGNLAQLAVAFFEIFAATRV